MKTTKSDFFTDLTFPDAVRLAKEQGYKIQRPGMCKPAPIRYNPNKDEFELDNCSTYSPVVFNTDDYLAVDWIATLTPEKMTWEEAKAVLRSGGIVRRKGHSDRFQVDKEGRIVVLGSNIDHVTKFTLPDFNADDWVECCS